MPNMKFLIALAEGCVLGRRCVSRYCPTFRENVMHSSRRVYMNCCVTYRPLRIRALWSPETSLSDYPLKQSDILAGWNPQLYHCDNIRIRIHLLIH
jgi:hypothetical protein